MTTILTAQAVHTIDAGTSGDAIAIDDGQILAVGSAADLAEAHPGATVDDRYGDQVILPGFVEAHAHSMAGGIWQHLYVGYFDSRGPDGKVWSGCRTLDAVIERLAEAEAALDDPYEPLLAWGWDSVALGCHLTRRDLDETSTTRCAQAEPSLRPPTSRAVTPIPHCTHTAALVSLLSPTPLPSLQQLWGQGGNNECGKGIAVKITTERGSEGGRDVGTRVKDTANTNVCSISQCIIRDSQNNRSRTWGHMPA